MQDARPGHAYEQFARALIAGGIVTDPWVDGAPRFDPTPERITPALHRALTQAGEQIALVYDELGRVVADDESLLADFFNLTPFQRALWLASAPLWHGIARADVFVTDDGLAVAELNCDTPTGEAEALELSRLVHPRHAGLVDPNAGLERRFIAMIEAYRRGWLRGGPRTVGIVYPTEFTEDLCVIKLYQRALERAGYAVVLGSPFNLGQGADGQVTLFDVPVALVLRHYKTDWWTERSSAWDDDAIPDHEPLRGPLALLLDAVERRACVVVNPFGAVLPQNKRAMAFMWEHIHRFSPQSQQIVERLVPYTSRLESLLPEMLLATRADWVLKSDYGAEGEEVILGCEVSDEVWADSIRHARRGRWVAQRYFRAQPRADGTVANYGVFVIAGEAAGLYLRTHRGKTDASALSVPVLVEPSA
jgi:glutathionylspermidine synthase